LENHYCDNNGSVWIMELDLETGETTTWGGDEVASDTDRFAEFLLECEWNKTTNVQASLNLPDPTEAEPELVKITIEPVAAKKIIEDKIGSLLYRIHCLDGGDEICERVRNNCGESVTLDIDVAGRTLEFSGNGKKVKVKVPENHLRVRKSQVTPWFPK